MSLWKLAGRSLFFYWRTNLGILLSVMAGASVLTGALITGDSVRFSLMKMAEARLGRTHLAIVAQNRFFTTALADGLAEQLDTSTVPILQLRGLITNDDGTRRANRVEVLGVGNRFYQIGGAQSPFQSDWGDAVALNEPLAERLGVQPGDEVVLRMEAPSLMHRDVALTPDSDLSLAFRLKVGAVVDESQFGRFSLQANQVSPLNVFLPIQWLQEKIERVGQANIVLVAGDEINDLTVEKADEAIRRVWNLEDAQLELRRLGEQGGYEIRSSRVFIESNLSRAALDAGDDSVGILTYFVNGISLGDRATPYSMVSAIEPSSGLYDIIPQDMTDEQIIINQWLADDLSAEVGDTLKLSYYVLTQTRKLEEQSADFVIRDVLPMEGRAVDPNLMPDFPGLSNADNCRDWDPGVSIDLDRIRDKDEDYWDIYKGSPKAFITLKAGHKIWANRYGDLTAVRYQTDDLQQADIAQAILDSVEPASVGLFFLPVRQQAEKAGGGSTDFGMLFLGLSMFLIISALILTGLVFVFGVESRSGQIGMLLAVGLKPRLIRRLFLLEGGLLSAFGTAGGLAAGILYTKVIIYGLSTIWRSAVGGSEIFFHAESKSLLAGSVGAFIVSLIAIRLSLRGAMRRPARELLVGGLTRLGFDTKRIRRGRIGLWIALAAAIGAALFILIPRAGDSSTTSGSFFAAGALLLIAGLGLTYTFLKMLVGGAGRAMKSLATLGLRNATRRTGRSLAVVGLLASGIFLVIAIGANKVTPPDQAQRRDSGTGGFALFGESTISILYDLNSLEGRKAMRLEGSDFDDVQFVQMRVYEGDDASCFNLNRAQKPRLWSVQPEQLQQRGAFKFADVIKGVGVQASWELLNLDLGRDVVPAVGDYTTIVWALGKSVGDELEYVDETGRPFKLQIVGMVESSILQGGLIISEDEFIRRFPSVEGYRMFLIDARPEQLQDLTQELTFRLSGFGLDLTPTTQRLAEFMTLENTYLSIFLLLGALGLILGSVGMGLVVLRNVLERRGELAMLRAVGFDKKRCKRLLFDEHISIMFCGLLCGVISALCAVIPALKTRGTQVPFLTIIAIGLSSVLWIWLAATVALRGNLLEALRSE